MWDALCSAKQRRWNRQSAITYPLMVSILLMVSGFMSPGNSSVSSISTISTSPDWISAAPSHEIIIGIQSPPPEQFSGVCNKKKKKRTWWETTNFSLYNQLIFFGMYLVVWLVWYFDVDPPQREEKTKCRKTSTTNNSSRSHSRSSYGINVGFINFLICKFLMLIARALHGNLSCGCAVLCVLKTDNNMHMETNVCSCKPRRS